MTTFFQRSRILHINGPDPKTLFRVTIGMYCSHSRAVLKRTPQSQDIGAPRSNISAANTYAGRYDYSDFIHYPKTHHQVHKRDP